MKEAGCIGVNIGLESGSDRILGKLKAGCTTDGFRRNYHAVIESGIAIDSTFMIANENETEEDLKATFDFLIENDMEQTNFSPVVIYPGTSIYNKAKKRELIKDELHYLTKEMSYRPWRVYNIAEFPYVNISAIPDDRLWESIVKQTRRYFTHLFENFQAKDIVIQRKKGNPKKLLALGNSVHDILKITGKCFKCDYSLEKNIAANNTLRFIEVKEQCPKCLANNYFDLTTDKSTLTHFTELKQSLSRAKKILILGRGENALDLFFYDIIGLDLDKVIGVVDERSEEDELAGIEEHSNSGKRFFLHLPRYRAEEIRNLDFDVALVTDLIPEVLHGFYPAEFRESLLWLTPESGPLSTPVNLEIMPSHSVLKSVYHYFQS